MPVASIVGTLPLLISDAAALNSFAAIFLCDVPKISAPLAESLAAYSRGTNGGRIVWILGPNVNAASYNETLLAQVQQTAADERACDRRAAR